jgi:hypothetical protein
MKTLWSRVGPSRSDAPRSRTSTRRRDHTIVSAALDALCPGGRIMRSYLAGHHAPHGPMSLVECSECGQRVASVASVCPRCSCFFGYRAAPGRSHISWPVPVLVTVLLLLIAILGITGIPRINIESQPPTGSTAAQLIPATVTSPPTATPRSTGPSTRTKWTSTWVNVREGRGSDTRIVQVLDPRQPVEVDSLQGRWWGLHIDGKRIGYVANSVLQNESPDQ